MPILKELLLLTEANEIFELKDLAKAFPEKADLEKHIHKLWGTHKLTFGGVPFFDDVYDKIDDYEQKFLKGTLSVNEEPGITLDIEGGIDVPIDSMQECYVGYDVKENTIYVGFDAWLDKDDFEKSLEQEDINPSEVDEDAGDDFTNAQNTFDKTFVYVMFELNDKLEIIDANVYETMGQSGSFYPEGRRRAERMGLIDVRLD